MNDFEVQTTACEGWRVLACESAVRVRSETMEKKIKKNKSRGLKRWRKEISVRNERAVADWSERKPDEESDFGKREREKRKKDTRLRNVLDKRNQELDVREQIQVDEHIQSLKGEQNGGDDCDRPEDDQ